MRAPPERASLFSVGWRAYFVVSAAVAASLSFVASPRAPPRRRLLDLPGSCDLFCLVNYLRTILGR